jgi:hypothetical protein
MGITEMHKLFGKMEGKTCSECKYFQKGEKESCLIHQKFTSNSEIKWSDWDACGQLNCARGERYLTKMYPPAGGKLKPSTDKSFVFGE